MAKIIMASFAFAALQFKQDIEFGMNKRPKEDLGLESKSCEEHLRELGLFSLETRMFSLSHYYCGHFSNFNDFLGATDFSPIKRKQAY
ncbi:hypothetical protein DUI87_16240 [Hirundo rustica rustica]|uniref:Uncharacterized protein n=1 Tax=Hirundo rustica rustica TaxID=333673 RepID=A0A3M0K664_HIRRU|nr:hypothetical protein DUI87_16240 [Hirundo rustica rustica]